MNREIGRFEMLRRESENADLRRRIGGLNGVSPYAVVNSEVKDLYNDPYNDVLWRKYLGERKGYFVNFPRSQEFGQLAETLLDLPPLLFSYGLFAANYTDGLHLHKKAVGTKETPHTSLLVGALTNATIHEYAASVKKVYPDAHAEVIDINTEHIPKIEQSVATFSIGDAIDMHFDDKIFDSVHTNVLFSSLASRRDAPYKTYSDVFYTEAARVLKDDGVLLLVEPQVHMHMEDLINAGFSYFERKNTVRFTSRREMERVLYSRREIETDKVHEVVHDRSDNSLDLNFYVASKIPLRVF